MLCLENPYVKKKNDQVFLILYQLKNFVRSKSNFEKFDLKLPAVKLSAAKVSRSETFSGETVRSETVCVETVSW